MVLTNLWQAGAGPTEPDNQRDRRDFCHFVIGLLSSVAVQCVECGVWSIDDITITITITGHNRKVTSANKLFSQRSSNNKNWTKCFKISKISFRPTKQINWIRSSKSEKVR